MFTTVFILLAAAQVRLTPPDAAADRLVADALRNAPEVAAARAAVDAAQHRVEPARTLPDPSASIERREFTGVMLTQPLPWPGKLSLAGRTAESEARETEAGMLGRAAAAIEARVRNAWYDLAFARAIDRLIDERRETARQIEATTRDRYAAGLAVQQDVLRAQVELLRIDELQSAQRSLITGRLAELNRLAGPQADAQAASLPAIAPIPPLSDVIATVAARNPEIASTRQGVESGRLRVDMAKKNFLPDFVVGAGVMNHAEWQASVGVSLPVWSERRQQNQLAEAKALVVERTAESDAIGRDLEVRTRERLAQLQAANENATLYAEKIVPLDQLSYESALASYQAGKVPFITVFEAVNVLYADRATYLGRLAEAAKWRVAIDEGSLQ